MNERADCTSEWRHSPLLFHRRTRESEKKKQKDNVNLGAGSKIFFDLLAIHKKHKNLVFITEIKMGAVSVVFYCQHFL